MKDIAAQLQETSLRITGQATSLDEIDAMTAILLVEFANQPLGIEGIRRVLAQAIVEMAQHDPKTARELAVKAVRS